VALLDRGHCGGVDTGHTTAHLTGVTDKRLHQLQDDFGKNNAQAAWHAGLAALDQIAANVRAENIDCEFKWVPGYLHAAPDGDISPRNLPYWKTTPKSPGNWDFLPSLLSPFPISSGQGSCLPIRPSFTRSNTSQHW
jgi:hypothetical protein